MLGAVVHFPTIWKTRADELQTLKRASVVAHTQNNINI